LQAAALGRTAYKALVIDKISNQRYALVHGSEERMEVLDKTGNYEACNG